MLLRRILFVLDIAVLLAIVIFLVALPAERCANFRTTKSSASNTKCHLHPVHHPNFSFDKNLKNHEHLESPEHFVSVCHKLQWSHFSFWDNMYLILLPAVACVLLILYTICEIMEFEYFIGQVQSTMLVICSVMAIFYTVAVISIEKSRITSEWPLLHHVHLLGADKDSLIVQVPKSWQMSIAMCILSALFKIGRILIQHFIGDKKLFFDDDSTDQKVKNPKKSENPSENEAEISGTTRMLNESRYSRLEVD